MKVPEGVSGECLELLDRRFMGLLFDVECVMRAACMMDIEDLGMVFGVVEALL